jgi:hypothetical protein
MMPHMAEAEDRHEQALAALDVSLVGGLAMQDSIMERGTAAVEVTVRLDDLRRLLSAAHSNPYLFDGDDGPLDYLGRIEAVIDEVSAKAD